MRKRIVVCAISFIAIAVVIFQMCVGVSAMSLKETDSSGMFEYSARGANAASITKYIGTEENVVIPDKIDGREVVFISSLTFYQNNYVKNVTLPESIYIYDVCNELFVECDSLESVTIPSTVKTIGGDMAVECKNFKSYYVDEANPYFKSVDGVLFDKEMTTLIEYPRAKEGDTYTVPESVTTIGEVAFCENDFLVTINVMKNVSTIQDRAFISCSKLEKILVDEENAHFCSENGVLFDKEKKVLVKYPENIVDAEYVIPETVESIRSCAFASNWHIVRVVIPDGVSEIKNATFAHCERLAMIVIPKSVITISSSAFNFCSNLWHVFYEGTKTEWEKFDDPFLTQYLNRAFVHFESKNHSIVSIEKSDRTCFVGTKVSLNCTECKENVRKDLVTTHALGHNVKDSACERCHMPKEDCIESPHNYPVGCDLTWTINKPGALNVSVTFSEGTYIWPGENTDYVKIYDGKNNLVNAFTKDEADNKKVTVDGDTLVIRLKSNEKITSWGFIVEKIEVEYPEGYVTPGTTVEPTPMSTVTPSPTPEPSEPTGQAKIPEKNWGNKIKVKVGKKFTWSIKVKTKKVKKLKLTINKKGKKLLKVVKRKKIKRGYKITFKAKKKGKTKIKAVVGKEKFTLNVTIKKASKKK